MPTVYDPPVHYSFARKALGVFVILQFVFVLFANITGFLGVRPTIANRYLEATGQPQGWGMFEAGAMRNSVAWDVRIELPEGRVERVRSVAKLPDEVALWNPPAVQSRRFVYESSILGIDLVLPNDPARIEPMKLHEEIRISNGIYLAFFRSIYKRERKPDWPPLPVAMELVILRAPTYDPTSRGSLDCVPRYVARWRPSEASAEYLEVEAYDLDAPDPPYRKFARP